MMLLFFVLSEVTRLSQKYVFIVIARNEVTKRSLQPSRLLRFARNDFFENFNKIQVFYSSETVSLLPIALRFVNDAGLDKNVYFKVTLLKFRGIIFFYNCIYFVVGVRPQAVPKAREIATSLRSSQ